MACFLAFVSNRSNIRRELFVKHRAVFPNERSFTFEAVEVAIKSGSEQARPSAQFFPDSLKWAAQRECSCRLETERTHAANIRASCGFRGWLGTTVSLAGCARTGLFQCRSFGANSIQNTAGLASNMSMWGADSFLSRLMWRWILNENELCGIVR